MSAQPDRAGRYTVKFDNGTVLRLYRQTVEDFYLFPGKEMEDTDLAKLQDAAGKMSAKMRAVRIVSATSVSRADLEQRLVQKGESKDDARQAVAWMTDLELVNDEETARQIVQRCIAKGYGAARARQALYEKRIPKEYWDGVLADYPDQTDKILAFLRTKLQDPRDEKALRRAIDSLIRRGHSYQEIRKALRLLPGSGDLQEDIYD